jgi:arylsulfatase A-like enzyme
MVPRSTTHCIRLRRSLMTTRARKPNILFIMADQLRWDYLGCSGHPHIRTPNIDALARRGVRFDRAFIQAPVCGGSRMSTYTGRYNITHGATYNNFPLRVDEWTMGDYLRPLGYNVSLIGKTHFKPDLATMQRLGLSEGINPGVPAMHAGFDPVERDDGLHPDEANPTDLAYNQWLRQLGYPGDNPWHSWANSVEGENGEVLSGWSMRNARRPARVRAEHSETAYMTDRAIDFIDRMGDAPWCLHLSYIKPHWPYIAPAPYHAMYGPEHVIAPNRSDSERSSPHPVVGAFMKHEESQNFSRDEVRDTVIPTYMGLITEFDHHIGRVFGHLDRRGLGQDTIIVVTSDHGDYLGDHWLGEKDLFHEEIVRVPLIIADPRNRSSHGHVSQDLVEAIDLAPTFLEVAGGEPHPHRLEGQSLMPLLAGNTPPSWRDAVFCDSDYAVRHARRTLELDVTQARGFMVRTAKWKYVHYPTFEPHLFDLVEDPQEQNDLGLSADHVAVRSELERRLLDWALSRKTRTTISEAMVESITGTAKKRGYRFGEW